MTFKINQIASREDIEAAARLFRAYATALGIDLSFQDFEEELASLPGKYAPPTGALLLARAPDGAPLGCVAMRPMRQMDCCEMKRLYVSPAARGMGLGKALVKAIVATADAAGYREMRLDTLPTMTEALSLYVQIGFEPIPPYYDTPVEGTLFLARVRPPDA